MLPIWLHILYMSMVAKKIILSSEFDEDPLATACAT